MSRKSVLSAILIVLTSAALAGAGEIIDRIVATVNGRVILQSDWEEALRFQAFLDGRSAEAFTAAERKAALDRLIDQELLREQMRSSDFDRANAKAVHEKIQEVRRQYGGGETDAGWHAVLQRYGLSEAELADRIALQVNLMRLINARLRPGINIPSENIEAYYRDKFLAQLREKGAKEVPLEAVSPKIKELLAQQRMDELLSAWLQSLRSQSEIRMDPVLPSTDGVGQP